MERGRTRRNIFDSGSDEEDVERATKKETNTKPKSKRRWLPRWLGKSSDSERNGEGDSNNNDKDNNKSKDDDAVSEQEVDAQSIAQQSIQTKTTQATKNTKTIEDCETEYHEAIRDHDWDCLDGLLKEYDPELYKKPKKVVKSVEGKKKLKFVKYLPDISKLRKEKEDPEVPVSPLLALDKDGRTPLHVCLIEPTPKHLIIRVMNCSRNAAAVLDKEGSLPLHLAVENRRPIGIIEKFFVANRVARRKRLLTIENKQILVALSESAPCDIISNFMLTGKKHLIKEEVAEKVLFLLINRQYPMDLFRSFFEVISTDFAKERNDSTGCGVVAAQFRVGCIKHKTNDEREKDTFVMAMNKLVNYETNLVQNFVSTPQTMEWWEKLKYLINLWSTHFWEEGIEDRMRLQDQVLIHNALMNPDSPPALIQLLANLYPESLEMKHPKAKALPIHFACRQWQFRDYPPRRGEKKFNLDEVCLDLLNIDPTATRKRYRRRLPLHHSIAVSKTWDFIKPLATHDPKSLLTRDPITKLCPFQMAALKIQETFDIEMITRREFVPKVWEGMTDDEQDLQMRKLLYIYDLKQLDLIYELLRHSPDAILIGSLKQSSSKSRVGVQMLHLNIVAANKTKIARSTFGVGNVGGHFIGWCYEKLNGTWKPHRTHFAVVKEAIMDGFIPINMDKWWRKLKVWLWFECPWDNIPHRDDFLLHCALCNPNVTPWIVELILECFPRSTRIPLPDSNGCYPLHIACSTDTYIPLSFEFVNKRNVIEMVAKVFHDAILLKYNNLLPLHYAISSSKKWEEMKFMAEDEPVSLAVPDSESDFFPFQLMALYKSYSKEEMGRFQNIDIKRLGSNEWAKAGPNEKVTELKQILIKHEIETMGCIFELLRHNPMLVHVGGVDLKNQSQRYGVDSVKQPAGKLCIQQYIQMLDESDPSSWSRFSRRNGR
ncbi:hypothetical protein FRACYDRAFT_235785 [Fragilariopsis cylindrus CCMP1102]|uniref:Uncharacterized protein n=1 Tax=Fragilariopsis cylindrus CCMP1102 TaxID=635003 RepID=A0A1E7FNI2_9STRA|nr:hypothetical protein FRACYDRAFT_235785 [Fragilariopsis cylindrus CCMP1102]|eukprot:OEU19729.1 hypothetical protein FRACYDRAFT_235785 [Fragilariopsis cylindrus CCMP1102]